MKIEGWGWGGGDIDKWEVGIDTAKKRWERKGDTKKEA